MKMVLIHGQNHKGSTYMIARELADKVKDKMQGDAEINEFFLPEAFNEPCRGCFSCFENDLTKCPHYPKLDPVAEAVLSADLLILGSPVYVYHASGQMMNFLDHFGTWWVVHRPRVEMCKKQAVVMRHFFSGLQAMLSLSALLGWMSCGLDLRGNLLLDYGRTVEEPAAERMVRKADSKTVHTVCMVLLLVFIADCILSALFRTPITY